VSTVLCRTFFNSFEISGGSEVPGPESATTPSSRCINVSSYQTAPCQRRFTIVAAAAARFTAAAAVANVATINCRLEPSVVVVFAYPTDTEYSNFTVFAST
jgi:hypothetical protein